jgi:hypothetical protein
VACAALAALLPGDAITLLLETVPLYLLYEASILVASFLDRSAGGTGESAFAREGGGSDRGGESAQGGGPHAATVPRSTDDPAEPSVNEIIDHVDPGLHG